jgi:Fic family protein
MQIISGRLDDEPQIHFEAPPSKILKQEMDGFISWFNDSKNSLPPLTRAALAHLYFVSIHPFEDGNGRIARALAIKALSQSIKQPLLTSLSTIIEQSRKKYYKALEDNNRSLDITDWLEYFGKTFIESQNHTQKLIEFLLAKTRMFDALKDKLNDRQQKVLTKLFAAGPNGFEGGLSAENYIKITKTSRATATRDLHDLLEMKALSKRGELKGTRYFLSKVNQF